MFRSNWVNIPSERVNVPFEWVNVPSERIQTTGTVNRVTMIIKNFEEAVATFHSNIAIKMETGSFTYGQLNRLANRLAAHIIRVTASCESGQGKKQLTAALLFEHGADMITSLIGALKAGMVYLPLDRTYPEARLVYMLENSEAALILTNNKNRALAEVLAGKVAGEITIVDIRETSAGDPDKNPELEVSGSKPAYILYTSGSTGRPKGVVQNRENVLYYTRNWIERFSIGPDDRMTLLTAFSHDGFVQDLWSALLSGATLYPYDVKNVLEGGSRLPGFIKNEGITIWHSVPTLYRYFTGLLTPGDAGGFPHLRYILLGGEALRKHDFDMFKHFFPAAKLANVYGQTESSVGAIAIYEPGDSFGLPVLGEPLDKTEILLITEEGEIVEDVGSGEIVIACDHIADGYWKDERNTAAVFSHDEDLGKLYWTGDLGRLMGNGEIAVTGRKDFQIKIRGFRVELGEIETALLELNAVKEAVVTLQESKDGEQEPYLCCYFTLNEPVHPGGFDSTQFREYLLHQVPDYMIPKTFMPMEKIPLTPSGKIDRNALPAPESLIIKKKHTPPASKREKQLAHIWQEVLNEDSRAHLTVGLEDNFFELGGHSLKAIDLIAKVHKVFQVKLELEEVFAIPTLQDMARHIEGKSRDTFEAVPAVEKKQYYRLSSAQRRLFFLHQMDPGGTGYNLSNIVEFSGQIDRERVENTFRKLIRRHESLRTSFRMKEDQPVQVIHEDVKFDIQVIAETKEFVRPFDLSQAPLIRLAILRQEEMRHLIMVDMHHIISDGTSQVVLSRDFQRLYNGEDLARLEIQYKDYACWQNREIEKGSLIAQESYWLEKFNGPIPVLQLPTDYQRPPVQSFAGKNTRFALEANVTEELKHMARQQEVTLYMVLLALVNALLFKMSDQEDIVVGTPVAGRRHADLEGIIGMFVNTLPLRFYPGREKTFVEFLREVKENSLAAFENQEYPFEDLVEKVSPARDTSRNPLFDVMFVLHNQENLSPDVEGLLDTGPDASTPFRPETSKFDLSFGAIEAGELLGISIEYSTAIFKPGTIERFTRYFKTLIDALLENPFDRLEHIDILPEEEKKSVLYRFNDTTAPLPGDLTFLHLFSEQADLHPHRTAITFDSRLHISYGELNRRANRLAGWLMEQGVGAGTIAAVSTERSIEIIIAVLGILKSGAAYLPIDPAYPQERVDYLLKDSGACLLVDSNTLTVEAETPAKRLHLPPVPACDPAYIIYTSGTTGRPKGVMIEHRALANLCLFSREDIDVRPEDRVLQFANFTFDVSVWELTMALSTGSVCCPVPPAVILDTGAFETYIERLQVTVAVLPPPYLLQVNPRQVNSLKLLAVAGSEASRALVHRWKDKATFVNAYGPTETTVIVTYWNSTAGDFNAPSVPIGKPMRNIAIYILDRQHRPRPIGVAGELYIAGTGVARGYLNRPELTAERFVISQLSLVISESSPNDQCPMTNDILYRTGDLARWLADGNIEFLGRIDRQVKIRGFRIEPAEIEHRLMEHPAVKETVVTARESNEHDKYLCAYIVPYNGTSENDTFPSPELLRQHLSLRLPDYMIPAFFVPLDSVPLTAHGKVDTKALPEPGLQRSETFEPPSDEVEQKLAAVWAQVLEIEESKIGRKDNFFLLGGHSLKAFQLAAQIHKSFNIKIPLVDIFRTPHIAGIASCLSAAAEERFAAIEKAAPAEYYPLSPAQKRMYLLQQMDENSTAYNIPGLFHLEIQLDRSRLEETLHKLVRRHESLRTSFHFKAGEPVQIIHGTEDINLDICYFSPAPDVPLSVEIPRIMQRFIRPFSPDRAPLFRVGVIAVQADLSSLAVDLHHIICDGISIEILVKDFLALYQNQPLPPLQLQYKDFACWQADSLIRESVRKQGAYWHKLAAGEIPVLNLPLDFPRPAVQRLEGGRVYFEIDAGQTAALEHLAVDNGCTLYMVLLAAFGILLRELSGQDDFMLGTPTAGRRHAGLEKIIGMFVNTLTIRLQVPVHRSFKEYLETVKQQMLTAFENQDYPFEELVEKIRVERDPSRHPVFDVMFAMNVTDRTGQPSSQPQEPVNHVSRFDLTCEITREADRLSVCLEYASRLFKKETVERFAGYYKTLLTNILSAPDQLTGAVEIMSQEEKETVLSRFNDTAAALPADLTFLHLFSEQVKRQPDSIAVISGSGHGHLTYSQLNRKTDNLAGLLMEKGVSTGTIAAVSMERSIEIIIAILAILKTGAAYLPIDPAYPQERVEYMLKDSRACFLVNGNTLAEKPKKTRKQLPDLHANEPAYILYTSGTTGRPKGVIVEHRGLVNLSLFYQQDLNIRPGDRVLQFANFTFDASVWEIVMALSTGSVCFMVQSETTVDAATLEDYLERLQVTVAALPPPFLFQVNPQRVNSLKLLIAGGSEVSRTLVDRWKDKTVFINAYGPTEATVDATWWQASPDDPGTLPVPIGKPIRNTSIYILDRHLRPRPIGVAGELCIAGTGIARGYLNRPELTAEKFVLAHSSWLIAHSQNAPDEKRMPCNDPTSYELRAASYRFYRTGDLARWLPDGNLEFLGRIDFQVKIRGYRIEPAEIEHRLREHRTVKEAVVLAREEQQNDKYLCAYIVPENGINGSGASIDTDQLRQHLSSRLADYMIPAYFVQLETIPLTANGKVDRKALPEPGREPSADSTPARDYVEKTLAEIWARVLWGPPAQGSETAPGIGIDANFFEIGGHSLKASVMTAEVHKELGVKIPLLEVFKFPTIRGLARHIKTASVKAAYDSIQPTETRETYSLSPAQKRMYIIQQLAPDSRAYNMPHFLTLEGQLDDRQLERTFRQLIHRHEVLRTSFHPGDGEPFQWVHGEAVLNIRQNPRSAAEELDNQIEAFIQPFDLSSAPLLRVALTPLENRKHLLMTDMHHIICDGVSMGILAGDFLALYHDRPLSHLRLQYRDYAQWLQQRTDSGLYRGAESYWLERFQGDIPVLQLPIDFPRPQVQHFAAEAITVELTEQESRVAAKTCLDNDVSLFMLFLATTNILLGKLSGQEDIVLGTPAAGRNHADLQPIIGMFVNTLAIRNFPEARLSFREFLEQVRVHALEVFENQDYPLEELVERTGAARLPGRNPLFDVLIAMQYLDVPPPHVEDMELEITPFSPGTGPRSGKFDLTIRATETGKNLVLTLEYASHLFKKETAARFGSYLKRIWSHVLKNPDDRIADISLITEAEIKEIIEVFNATSAPFPADKTLHRLFHEQVSRTPDAIAAVDTTGYLSYNQLDRRADRLAGGLTEKGLLPGDIAAVMVENNIDTITAVLAILKAGASYLPMESNYPTERIRYLLQDSNAKMLLTNGETNMISHAPTQRSNPSSLAYVIYTSGSTGQPKGVMVEHRSAVNIVTWFARSHGLDSDWRILQLTSYTFDASVNQVFGALLHGASLYPVNRESMGNVEKLRRCIEANRINLVYFMPLFLQELLAGQPRLKSIEAVVSGGERLDDTIKNNILQQGYSLYNYYGPTETTVDALSSRCSEERVTLGKPVSNTACYILDRHNRQQPIGVAGELCIAGTGVAMGYLNNPELTVEKFVISHLSVVNSDLTNDQCPMTNDRLYRTGDLARRLPDGSIEFLGRIDLQVKIRGFRIEPGEIESHLLTHDTIKAAVVTAKGQNRGTKYLCAYIVPKQPGTFRQTGAAGELKKYLAGLLPEYMIPSYFVPLENLPLLPSGKPDRNALPQPEILPEAESRPPRHELDRDLIKIWSGILGTAAEETGIEEDFFRMGGSSLKTIKLISEIYKTFNVEIPMSRIFEAPTIKDISDYLMQDKFKNSREDIVVQLNRGRHDQKDQKNIFCFPPAIGYGLAYMQLANLVGGYSFYAFNYIENTGDESKPGTYVNKIIDIQPQGPYVLLGYSAGGRLCIKTAEILEKLGHHVKDIILLDCYSLRSTPAPEPAEKMDREFDEELEAGLEQLGLGHISNRVIEKMDQYQDFTNRLSLEDTTPLKSNIHLIKARDKRDDTASIGWEAFAAGGYFVIEGYGNHRDMLSPGYVEKNATLIRNILTGKTRGMPAALSPEVRQTHARLSGTGLKFLEYVRQHPEALEIANFQHMRNAAGTDEIHPWPTFIDPGCREKMEQAAVTTCNLVRSIPDRIFGNDPLRMSRYYELPVNMITTQMRGITDDRLKSLLARGDFVLTGAGFKCLEYNIAANIGGLHLPLWEPYYYENPIIARFLKEHRVNTDNTDTIAVFFEHLVSEASRRLSNTDGILHTAIAVPGDRENNRQSHLNRVYAETLQRLLPGVEGSVFFCDFRQLTVNDDTLYCNKKRIDILIETYGGTVPPEILELCEKQRIVLFNGPVTGLLSNKLNLALLSEHEDSHLFNSKEKEAINSYIPWTRKIAPVSTYFKDKREKIQLIDFIRLNREQLVIKPAVGFGGEGVYIGKNTGADKWEQILRHALEERKWLVQEYMASQPLLYQSGENGAEVHHGVWGLLVFGNRYGGASVRILPAANKSGVVNVYQGARASALFEIAG
jgi:amino acid adenylation domain-containing protein